ASDGAYVQGRSDEAPGEERHGGEENRGGEAARVADVRRRELVEMLGQRAAEFGKPCGRSVRVLVDGRVRLGGRVAEVRGDVDDPGPATGARRARKQR